MKKRALSIAAVIAALVVSAATPALACGGLVNPNGTVSLVKTTTLAGYRWGIEHYVTSFQFQGGGAEFGSIVPLPGIPKRVRRGGDWTLQRLVREVAPPADRDVFPTPAPAAGEDAEVILETEIDSLKITILKGGGSAVGKWAKENGFALSPDAPEVLDFYAARSPIFMAARFDPKKAKNSDKRVGDGVPIHLSIPTEHPWVPLRILGLGLGEAATIEADVFLLTKREPILLPEPAPAGSSKGTVLERSEPASASLLFDLRSDKGMGWVHESKMWLSYVRLDTTAGELTYDLAADVHGNAPSPVAAGLEPPPSAPRPSRQNALWSWGAALGFGFGSLAFTNRLLSRRS